MISKSQESSCLDSSGVTGIWPSLGVLGGDSTSRPKGQKRIEVPVSLCTAMGGDCRNVWPPPEAEGAVQGVTG